MGGAVNDEYRTIFADGEGVRTISYSSGEPVYLRRAEFLISGSVDGLYNQKYDYPPETILSHSFYVKHPEEFYRFYRDKMLCLDCKTEHRRITNWQNWKKQEN